MEVFIEVKKAFLKKNNLGNIPTIVEEGISVRYKRSESIFSFISVNGSKTIS